MVIDKDIENLSSSEIFELSANIEGSTELERRLTSKGNFDRNKLLKEDEGTKKTLRGTWIDKDTYSNTTYLN